MNILVAFPWPFSETVVEQLGWVLVHSLWQFALVALLAGIAVRAMQRTASTLRYGVLVVAMVISVAAPTATWLLMSRDVATSLANPGALTSAQQLGDVIDPRTDDLRLASDGFLASDQERQTHTPDWTASGSQSVVLPQATAFLEPESSWSLRTKSAVRPWLAWIVAGWSMGVIICSARPLLGWHTLRRLKRVGVSPVSDQVLAALDRVSERLGRRFAVRLLQSTLAQVPIVVGYFRPVILLPVSLATSIPAAQLEAILAHELAHVQRHDFIVNLLQTLVETLFFYHPAVWWLSRQIRVEREHCCDDLVVKLLNNRVEYGRALVAIEQQRGKNSVLALGATDGSLLSRVRRIVGSNSERTATSLVERWPAALLGIVLIGMATVLSMTWNLAAKDDRKTEQATYLANLQTDVQVSTEQLPPLTYVATFPDGAIVELLAVDSKSAHQDSQGWRPDGGVLLNKVEWPTKTSRPTNNSHNLLVRFSGLPEGQKIGWRVNRLVFAPNRGDTNPWTARVSIAAAEKETELRIGLTETEWGPWQKVDAAGKLVDPIEVPRVCQDAYTKIQPDHVKHFAGQAWLNWRNAPPISDQAMTEVVAIDNEGKQHTPYGSSLWGNANPQHADVFKLPLEQIDHFEYRHLPFRQWATFENVSLEPGQKTDAKVSVKSPPSLPNRYSANFPNGPMIELVGVCKNTARAREGWTPDGRPIGEVEGWDRELRTTIEKRADGGTSIGSQGTPSPDARDLLFKFVGLKTQPAITLSSFPGATGGHHFPIAEPYYNRISILLSQPSTSHTFRLGVTDEPWGTPQQISSTGELLNKLDDSSPYWSSYQQIKLVRAGPVADDEQNTELTVEWPKNHAELFAFEIKAIDVDGKDVWVLNESDGVNKDGQYTTRFILGDKLPRERLARFEYRLRPYRHWATFENVSLQQGLNTDVKVKLETVPDGKPIAEKAQLGTLTGRFVYDGEPPARNDRYSTLAEIDISQPQQPGPDRRFSGVEAVYREFLKHKIRPKTEDSSLLVSKDGGIANIVVWVVSQGIPWSRPQSELAPAIIRLQDGNFAPRFAAVTVGQPLLIENHDPVSLNFAVEFTRALNPSFDVLLPPGTTAHRVTFRVPEPYPATFQASLAPWAKGRVLVHSNSFVAVSQPDGSFTLPNLPIGDWEFQVWHERGGFVQHWPQGRFQQSIKPGDNKLGTIKLKPEHLGQKPIQAIATNPPPKNREQIGEVLGKPVFRDEVQDDTLRSIFLTPVLAKYQDAHRTAITPTVDEIEFAMEYFDKEHRQRLDAAGGEAEIREQMKAFEERLARTDVPDDEQQKLELAHRVLRHKLKPPERFFAEFMLNNWKFQRHLYDEFGGGRILWQQAGQEAFDATRTCLESLEKKGEFKITDTSLRTKLFDYWTRSHGSFLTDDKERIRKQFLEPAWIAPAAAKVP